MLLRRGAVPRLVQGVSLMPFTNTISIASFDCIAPVRLSEHQIEIVVGWRTDALDTRYIQGKVSDAEYAAALASIDAWAEAQHNLIGATA